MNSHCYYTHEISSKYRIFICKWERNEEGKKHIPLLKLFLHQYCVEKRGRAREKGLNSEEEGERGIYLFICVNNF